MPRRSFHLKKPWFLSREQTKKRWSSLVDGGQPTQAQTPSAIDAVPSPEPVFQTASSPALVRATTNSHPPRSASQASTARRGIESPEPKSTRARPALPVVAAAPLTVEVSIRFVDLSLADATYHHAYQSSPGFVPTGRICNGLLRRLEHCSLEFITREDPSALISALERDTASSVGGVPSLAKPERFELVFRIFKTSSSQPWAKRTFHSYQKDALTHQSAQAMIKATHHWVGLFLSRHDDGFLWVDDHHSALAGKEDSATATLPTIDEAPPSPLLCVPPSRSLQLSRSLNFAPGYTIELMFRSRHKRRAIPVFKNVLTIDSKQAHPLDLVLAESLFWQLTDTVQQLLQPKRGETDGHIRECTQSGCGHFDDEATTIEIKVSNNLAPDFSHLQWSTITKVCLFRDRDASDCHNFMQDVETRFGAARDGVDTQLQDRIDFEVRILELKGVGWAVQHPARFFSGGGPSALPLDRETVQAALERIQAGIGDVIRGHDVAARVAAYKRGHLVLDKAIVGHEKKRNKPGRNAEQQFATPDEAQAAFVDRLRARIQKDIDMVCQDTCCLDGIEGADEEQERVTIPRVTSTSSTSTSSSRKRELPVSKKHGRSRSFLLSPKILLEENTRASSEEVRRVSTTAPDAVPEPTGPVHTGVPDYFGPRPRPCSSDPCLESALPTTTPTSPEMQVRDCQAFPSFLFEGQTAVSSEGSGMASSDGNFREYARPDAESSWLTSSGCKPKPANNTALSLDGELHVTRDETLDLEPPGLLIFKNGPERQGGDGIAHLQNTTMASLEQEGGGPETPVLSAGQEIGGASSASPSSDLTANTLPPQLDSGAPETTTSPQVGESLTLTPETRTEVLEDKKTLDTGLESSPEIVPSALSGESGSQPSVSGTNVIKASKEQPDDPSPLPYEFARPRTDLAENLTESDGDHDDSSNISLVVSGATTPPARSVVLEHSAPSTPGLSSGSEDPSPRNSMLPTLSERSDSVITVVDQDEDEEPDQLAKDFALGVDGKDRPRDRGSFDDGNDTPPLNLRGETTVPDEPAWVKEAAALKGEDIPTLPTVQQPVVAEPEAGHGDERKTPGCVAALDGRTTPCEADTPNTDDDGLHGSSGLSVTAIEPHYSGPYEAQEPAETEMHDARTQPQEQLVADNAVIPRSPHEDAPDDKPLHLHTDNTEVASTPPAQQFEAQVDETGKTSADHDGIKGVPEPEETVIANARAPTAPENTTQSTAAERPTTESGVLVKQRKSLFPLMLLSPPPSLRLGGLSNTSRRHSLAFFDKEVAAAVTSSSSSTHPPPPAALIWPALSGSNSPGNLASSSTSITSSHNHDHHTTDDDRYLDRDHHRALAPPDEHLALVRPSSSWSYSSPSAPLQLLSLASVSVSPLSLRQVAAAAAAAAGRPPTAGWLGLHETRLVEVGLRGALGGHPLQGGGGLVRRISLPILQLTQQQQHQGPRGKLTLLDEPSPVPIPLSLPPPSPATTPASLQQIANGTATAAVAVAAASPPPDEGGKDTVKAGKKPENNQHERHDDQGSTTMQRSRSWAVLVESTAQASRSPSPAPSAGTAPGRGGVASSPSSSSRADLLGLPGGDRGAIPRVMMFFTGMALANKMMHQPR